MARQSPIPKLYIHTVPCEVDHGRRRDFVRTFPSQTKVAIPGGHFVQEDSPQQLAAAIAAFARSLRA